jgi:hypothetical protein
MSVKFNFFLFAALLLSCSEHSNPNRDCPKDSYTQNFADTLLCICDRVKYQNDTNLFIVRDDFLATLISHIDDSTKEKIPDVSSLKSTDSYIPSIEIFSGLRSLCYLQVIVLYDDSTVMSKETLCRHCSLMTNEYDRNKYEKSPFLSNEKKKYESWYNETKGLTWDERKQVWKEKYMQTAE